MKVKTYKHESLQEGIETIKRDLGGDALILGTREVTVRPRFGLFKKAGWEITAAVEDKKPAPPAAAASASEPLGLRAAAQAADASDNLRISPPRGETPKAAGRSQGQSRTATVTAPAAAAVAVAPSRDQNMDALISEIAELKKSFRSLSKAIPAKSESGGLFSELVSQGIEHDLADQLISTASYGNPAPTELRTRVRRMIADQLIIAPPAELHAKSQIVSAFVGSTGVGKTTTIAKIAGHAAVRMKKKVALISTDMFRIGGQEQLTRFGELLGIPTYGCADLSTLKELVASLEDRDLILIDTPGSSPSDLARLSKLETVTAVANSKVHLVISATTRSEDITKIIIRFQRFRPNSVILTKLDETDSKGPLTGDLLRNEIPVSYVTNGQRVPEDLVIPTADELARYVLPVEPVI
jgi:flagellar biosynthesis protein FlhF